jgi:hypothetical protein
MYTPPGTAATRGAMKVSAPDAGAAHSALSSASRSHAAACQARLDFRSGRRLRGVAQQRAVGDAAHYREAATERRQRTHCIQRTRGESKALLKSIQVACESGHQPLAQLRGVRAQGLESMTRVLAP